mmetsp:Transcript_81159/g.173667  ORF Transcript_81159/g.173667 Transcript_81159/m.173667 type:complete len:264 (+) Transcript_81159:34-825(+)
MRQPSEDTKAAGELRGRPSREAQAHARAEEGEGIRVLHRPHRRVWHSDKGARHRRQGFTVQADERALVAHLVAVVGRREQGYELPTMLDAVALLAHLVASDDKIQAICLQEVLGYILTEGDANTALRRRTTSARIRIAPEHLYHKALVRRFAVAIYPPDVVDGDAILREKASVHYEDGVIDDVTQRQQVEGFAEEHVQARIVLGRHLSFKAVDPVHGLRLMVPSRQMQVLRVKQLPSEEGEDNLNGKRTAIHEVPVEEVRVRL